MTSFAVLGESDFDYKVSLEVFVMIRIFSLFFMTLAFWGYADVELSYWDEPRPALKRFHVLGVSQSHEDRHREAELRGQVLDALEANAREDVYLGGEAIVDWGVQPNTIEEVYEFLRQDYSRSFGESPWSEEAVGDLSSELSESIHLSARTLFVETNYWGGTGYTYYHLIYDDLRNVAYKIHRHVYSE